MTLQEAVAALEALGNAEKAAEAAAYHKVNRRYLGVSVPQITDLATAMAPELPHELIGIRPGEKIHEIMCPIDDSHLTLEFEDHFVIRPTITFIHGFNDYTTNALGATGTPVAQSFEYNSGTNPHFLTSDEIIAMNARIDGA